MTNSRRSTRLETTPSRPCRQAARRNASPPQVSWALNAIPSGGFSRRAARRVLRSRSGRAARSSPSRSRRSKTKGEAGAAAIGGLLNELEGGHAVRANAAEFAVEIGGFDLQRRERGGGGGIPGGPVEPGTGEKLDGALVDPGGDAVAVKFDLMDPQGSARGFCRELAKLRLDPFRRRHLAKITRDG